MALSNSNRLLAPGAVRVQVFKPDDGLPWQAALVRNSA